jgi:alpha-glucosidase
MLPGGNGYLSVTEAAIIDYSGMALQAEGDRRFGVRLGHEAEVSYPYVLRYGEEDAERLKNPASIEGTIISPWRVIMIGEDLNTLVNSDIIADVSPPPDPALFPEGFDAEWLKPGRAVWGYLNNGGRTLEDMKKLSRLAGQMGFEYHVVEGHWANWPVNEQRELIEFSTKQGIRIILWKHSKDLRDPEARHEFFRHCSEIGAAGAKIDFFDHEAKEIIDLYQACLREAAEYKLVLDFHGANKPAGEARTWPNEIVREGIRGFEWRGPWAVHNTTLPFTRMLAGHADYTPMHFGDRRADTSETHQIASAIILSGPLLIYAEHPANMLKHPAVDIIKRIPAVWDETIVLPCSEIGKIVAFARRSGDTWFVSVMNGPDARMARIDLTFLGESEYDAEFVRDRKGDATSAHLLRTRLTFGPKAGVEIDKATVTNAESIYAELIPGGGFVAMISPRN